MYWKEFLPLLYFANLLRVGQPVYGIMVGARRWAMEDPLWALFRTLVQEGLTLRAIRNKVKEAGHDLSEYDDTSLIRKMLEILKGAK